MTLNYTGPVTLNYTGPVTLYYMGPVTLYYTGPVTLYYMGPVTLYYTGPVTLYYTGPVTLHVSLSVHILYYHHVQAVNFTHSPHINVSCKCVSVVTGVICLQHTQRSRKRVNDTDGVTTDAADTNVFTKHNN